MHTRISLERFANLIRKNGLALIDILVGAVAFVFLKATGPIVPFIVKRSGKREPLAQFEVEVNRAVMVDVGNIILIAGLITAIGQAALKVIGNAQLDRRHYRPFQMRANCPEIQVAFRELLIVTTQAITAEQTHFNARLNLLC